jgi:hypothetical protein
MGSADADAAAAVPAVPAAITAAAPITLIVLLSIIWSFQQASA